MALKQNVARTAVRWICTHADGVTSVRHFSCTHDRRAKYKLVVVGGGTGGCATAANFYRKLGQGQVAVIEPSESHAYQPLWTLVGAGLKTLDQSMKPMGDVLPSGCQWIKDSVSSFDPENNAVITASGEKVEYEYLVVAAGLQLNYHKVPGLEAALADDPMVCSNYHPSYVTKTFPALQTLSSGNAIFTFPNSPVKCAGAPQKIMYLAEEIFRKEGKRDQINVVYNTALPVMFGVKKYADSLVQIVKDRNIKVNHRLSLVAVRHESREADFQLLDSEAGETQTFQYAFLHATPPMSAPDCVSASPLANAAGFVDVDQGTLRHAAFPNVFALGDASSLPTAKTAAAVASQSNVLKKNLLSVMKGDSPTSVYDGYTSCPLVTGSSRCILAEFDYNAQPLETFPFNQGKERYSMYKLKADFLPSVYWAAMTRGLWKGPAAVRKILHLGMGR